ncbi:biliverdin-producing heme oxygenase [Aureimonas populi]|uniref:Biliverdin-producing heme oxygenase n=1 Tax=Aureimonas populi TaxID=1701758 RepID=A0ABW5CHR2_9HYPH|nr:biliverdin-producing heme oxygenase [Aureimonas populi]
MPDAPRPHRPDHRLRARLREGTRERHERLDALFDPMFRTGDLAPYHRFIRMNHACHEALEPLIAAPLASLLPDWAEGSRLPQLRRDMAEMALAPLPAPAFGTPDTVAAVGIGYVLEGSRLGGMILLRRLHKLEAGALSSRPSAHYLASSEGAERFNRFLKAASGLDWQEARFARCLAAANAAFDCFLAAARAAGAEPEPRAAIS